MTILTSYRDRNTFLTKSPQYSLVMAIWCMPILMRLMYVQAPSVWSLLVAFCIAWGKSFSGRFYLSAKISVICLSGSLACAVTNASFEHFLSCCFTIIKSTMIKFATRQFAVEFMLHVWQSILHYLHLYLHVHVWYASPGKAGGATLEIVWWGCATAWNSEILTLHDNPWHRLLEHPPRLSLFNGSVMRACLHPVG